MARKNEQSEAPDAIDLAFIEGTPCDNALREAGGSRVGSDDDIDLVLGGPQYVPFFSSRLNATAEALTTDYAGRGR